MLLYSVGFINSFTLFVPSFPIFNSSMLTQSQSSSADSLKRTLPTQDLQTSHSGTNNTQVLEKELKKLHNKILDIENRLFTAEPITATEVKPDTAKKAKRVSLPLSPRSVVQVTKPKFIQFSPIRSSRSFLNSTTRMKQVQKSQREIASLELQAVQKSHTGLSIYTEIQEVRQQILEEQKRRQALYRDNTTLKKKLNKSEILIAQLAQLKEKYNSFVLQYEKSETIRQKQSKIIQLFKSELISRLVIPNKDLKR